MTSLLNFMKLPMGSKVTGGGTDRHTGSLKGGKFLD
jgi:hypothetical protein